MIIPDRSFIRQRGDAYRNSFAFQKSECVYDVTYHFAHRFLQKGDRTIDQMIQAARSGKQNIAEGLCDGDTSKEMEIKLLNVAKASLQELRIDYEDYLRTRNLQQWKVGDDKLEQTRRVCAAHNDSEYYRLAIAERSDETIANIALVLIAQTDKLLYNLIEKKKQDFLQSGGIKEEMARARREHRGY
ncbi:MAG: four helix bundle protein [Bacteroidaceae bacterium]|nr:four helix bundle protein [Bacteroidaceae bacterium]